MICRVWNLSLVLVCAAAAFACDEDDVKGAAGLNDLKEDAGTVDIDLPGEADGGVIADLDDGEKSAICQSLANGVNDNVSPVTKCSVGGIGAGVAASRDDLEALRAACNDFVGNCKDGAAVAADQAPDITLGACPLFKGETAACQTPLETFRKCVNYVGQQTVSSLGAIECDNVGLEQALSLAQGAAYSGLDALQQSADCQTVLTDCPGVFEVGGAGDAGAGDAGVIDGGADPDAAPDAGM